jgi:CBS domain-containing protein
VVSESDLVRILALGEVAPFEPGAAITLPLLLRGTPSRVNIPRVGDVMSTEVVSVHPEASIREAASLIDRHGFRRLPVVDGESFVVGVLTRSDLIRAMVRRDEGAGRSQLMAAGNR